MDAADLPPLRNIRDTLEDASDMQEAMREAAKRIGPDYRQWKICRDIGPGSQLTLGYHAMPLREDDMHIRSGKCRCEPEEEWIKGLRSPLWMHHSTTKLS